MNLRYILPFLMLLAACTSSTENKQTEKESKMSIQDLTAPVAEKKAHEMVAHGHTRVDDYFWMRLSDEQKNAETPDEQTQKVLDYLNAENDYTDKVLAPTKAMQDKLFDEIVGRIKKDDNSVPYFKSGYWYYTRFEKGKEYGILCRKKGTLEADEEILIDQNERAKGLAYYALGGAAISPDNKILAMAEDTLSRRIYTIKFKNLETGEFYEDELENTTGSVAWANDNKTVFYTTKNKVSLLSEKVYRHTLGAKGADAMVYQEKDPSYYIGCYRSKSGKYIIIYNSSTLSSDYHILSADNPMGSFKRFSPREKVHEYSISHYGDKFYIVTNWDAENFRLMETPENATSKDNWKEVIPHRENVLLQGVELFKNHMALSERSDALNHIRVAKLDANDSHYIDFDEEVYVARIGNNPEFDTDQLQMNYSSMTTPYTTYQYDMNTKERTLLKQQEVVGGHNPDDYHAERFEVKGRDGALIPVSLVYKKGFKKDGSMPILQYAYGSYGSTMDPGFSSVRKSLLDRGFGYAIAHVRGGQIKGRKWYEDGKMFKKKNTFNDFVDVSRYLIDQKYTSAKHLYALGGSAGGLLMGAIVNQAPQLYNGVIAAVPFVDVVSTMMDVTIPLTTNEFDEWGNPIESKDSYDYMLSYSPYDQVEAKDYPNLMVTTGLFDSQVQYWEPTKWVAKLRDMKTDNNILLLKTDMEVGHGGASGRFKRYKDTAIEYAWMLDLEGIQE